MVRRQHVEGGEGVASAMSSLRNVSGCRRRNDLGCRCVGVVFLGVYRSSCVSAVLLVSRCAGQRFDKFVV